MKYKYVLIRSYVYERKALENYINDMALKGWHIDSMYNSYLRFKKDNKKVHYSVLLMESQSEEDKLFETKHQKSFKSFMEDFEMKFVCSYGLWQIFESDNIVDIYNDHQVEFNYIDDIADYDRKELRWQMGFPVVLAICCIVTIATIFKSPIIEPITLDITVIILWILLFVGSACVVEERVLLSKYHKNEELESDFKVFRFRWVYTLVQISMILMFVLFINIWFGLWVFWWSLERAFMHKEQTRSRNAWIYYTIFSILLLGSCTMDNSGLIKEEIKNIDVCEEVGYKCTDYTSASTQFADKESFTGDPSGYSMIHIKIKDGSLKEFFIDNVDKMYSEKEISYIGNHYIVRVNDDEYWKIPGKKSNELYDKLNEYFFE